MQLSEIVPNPNSIIGYVTTGHFSLARGAGFAIGAISVVQLIELEQQSLRYFYFLSESIHVIILFILFIQVACKPEVPY